MTTASVVASGGVLPRKRRAIFVQLSSTECTEVDFKELARAHGLSIGTTNGDSSATVANAQLARATLAALDTDDADDTGVPLVTPRTQRFNIIERLEKRYGGGAVVGPAVGAGAGSGARDDDDLGPNVRGDDDDLYDSEDSFIDDAELQQNIEEIHTQARVQTKHSGFFVNAGDEIETIEGQLEDVDADADDAPTKKVKRPKKVGAESSRAVKAFLDEWSDAASDWQPGVDAVDSMDALRRAVREMTETTPFTKVFPRQLDDALRAVDKLVVDAHPNKWRVNGYFATLMTFLPFTKQYLKSNMLRLEARDAAHAIKDELERSIVSITTDVATYKTRIETESPEVVKQDILQGKEFATSLHRLLLMQDEWITKENDYRQMLKTEDKKHLKEQDYIQLNARQERNRLFNRVLALFPPGLMDLQTLRGLNRSAKVKGTRKPAPAKPANKSPLPTPKRKTPTAVAPEASTPAKRSIKPFKSRLMDDQPAFTDTDFDEIP